MSPPAAGPCAAQPDRGAIAFAERLIALLDEGAFTATYKFAVLLALLDLCFEGAGANGTPPATVSTAELARRVIELYWPQTNPYAGLMGPAVLRQNARGQAEMIRDILRFRERNAADPSASLSHARTVAPNQFRQLLEAVEWKLIEMPLPRLQVMGGVSDPFIFRIGWSIDVTPAEARRSDFDRTLYFIGRAAEYLVQLGGLLRPLIETKWANHILRFNRQIVSDARLPAFLFGAQRVSLAAVRPLLREVQEDRCFYCGGRLRSAADVDHFIPWVRWPDNSLENLVAAHPACNGSKRDFLAGAPHLAVWLARFSSDSTMGASLRQVAAELTWDTHPERTMSVARAIYLRVPQAARLWLARDEFEPADPVRLTALFSA